MSRWQPGAADRLRTAALALFESVGFEQVTVAQIAERAHVTERTFYRHYADKREVLFSGSQRLQQAMVDAVSAAPDDASAIDLIETALTTLSAFFPSEFLADARRRQAILNSQAGLQERELLKLATLKSSLAGALVSRRIDPARSSLAAEVTIGLFALGFSRWIETGEPLGVAHRAALDDLCALVREA